MLSAWRAALKIGGGRRLYVVNGADLPVTVGIRANGAEAKEGGAEADGGGSILDREHILPPQVGARPAGGKPGRTLTAPGGEVKKKGPPALSGAEDRGGA